MSTPIQGTGTSNNASRIVVGIDGSDSSVRAAGWAGAVAEKFGVSLHLVHSLSTAGHFIADAAVIAIRAAATADQQAVAEKVLTLAEQTVHQNFPGLQITSEATLVPAAKALIELSHTARLVVVGSDDVNPGAALLLGSTSLAVAMHAASPVIVWRGEALPNAQSVVVGVDGTPAGAAALDAAFDYADRFGVPLTAVHAWSIGVSPGELAIPYIIDRDALETAEVAVLTDAVAEVSARYPDVDVRLAAEQLKPGHALLRHLDGAQLVVVGNHRRNVLSAVVLGSTSLNLLHHSAVPVMVCHATRDRGNPR